MIKLISCLILFLVFDIILTNSATADLLTLNSRNMAVKQLLHILAQYSNKNIVVNDSISGKVDINLVKVNWQQALQAIMAAEHLTAKKVDNILYIAPIESKNLQQEGFLKTQLIPLKYAKAEAIAKAVKPQLVKPDQVSVDVRENVILLRAKPKELNQLQQLILKLDKPVPQVMIAVKIVSVDSNYEKQLGIRFGITNGNHLSGTLNAANQLAAGKNAAAIEPNQRLAVDLPVTSPAAGRLGLALFRFSAGTLLDLELSALQAEGRAKIISSPELLATNQQAAEIQSGQEIPYQEKAGEGSTSVTFKKAVLSLHVVPQVIPGNKVLLHLKVTQDKQGSKEVLGVPTIDTRELSTNVLLKNGQTVVLGGIYEQLQTNNIERVPFIASLPIIGPLFRYRRVEKSRRELLIFVTPKIIKE